LNNNPLVTIHEHVHDNISSRLNKSDHNGCRQNTSYFSGSQHLSTARSQQSEGGAIYRLLRNSSNPISPTPWLGRRTRKDIACEDEGGGGIRTDGNASVSPYRYINYHTNDAAESPPPNTNLRRLFARATR